MVWHKALSAAWIGCLLTLSLPLFSATGQVKKTKTRFEVLMGDCKQARYPTPPLKAADYADLKKLGKAYRKNISFLKKSRLKRIPHKMHLIWIGPRPFPEESLENVRSFRKHHPKWIMNFWTDSPDRQTPIPGMVKRLITHDYFLPILDLYTKSTNYGEKADLLRFVIMYKEGGLYFDHDATCLRSFDGFADHFDFVTACDRMQYHDGLNSNITPAIGLFLCRPKHPILRKSMSLARSRWDTAPNYAPHEVWRRVIYRTFDSFAAASKLLQNTAGNRDIILPTAYFYPNFTFKKPFVKKLQKAGYVYSVHGYKGEWK